MSVVGVAVVVDLYRVRVEESNRHHILHWVNSRRCVRIPPWVCVDSFGRFPMDCGELKGTYAPRIEYRDPAPA
jgi:hypothetical protein